MSYQSFYTSRQSDVPQIASKKKKKKLVKWVVYVSQHIRESVVNKEKRRRKKWGWRILSRVQVFPD